MKEKGGLGSALIIGAVLLIIAGAYLNNEGLTDLGMAFLSMVFWVIIALLVFNFLPRLAILLFMLWLSYKYVIARSKVVYFAVFLVVYLFFLYCYNSRLPFKIQVEFVNSFTSGYFFSCFFY